ncbi:MAG: DEAD/DEAH box helicase [Mangrovibacterium sp.]
MTFKDLGIIDPILQALNNKGYSLPTAIQEETIPILLKGSDLLGCAQTGTGKTAAFAIPIIQLLVENQETKKKPRRIRALIITPTRELAIQIDENFTEYAAYTHLKNAVIFGGVKQNAQVAQLRQGVDILVATPGRLLDLVNQKIINLKDINYFVLDEADQMLDMGFIHDIKKLLTILPKKRQSLFFSATMPPAIKELINLILHKYQTITIKPQQTTAEKVSQAVYKVPKAEKTNLLIELLKERPTVTVIVFTRTKHGADKVVRKLTKAAIKSAAIHGNKSQNQRQKALSDFKSGELNVLIATDIAARGIDVSGLSLVINFDLPNIPESYVHRIGRTGRADASGDAISFCDIEERPYLRDIEKLIKQSIPVIENHNYVDTAVEKPTKKTNSQEKTKQGKPNRNKRRTFRKKN